MSKYLAILLAVLPNVARANFASYADAAPIVEIHDNWHLFTGDHSNGVGAKYYARAYRLDANGVKISQAGQCTTGQGVSSSKNSIGDCALHCEGNGKSTFSYRASGTCYCYDLTYASDCTDWLNDDHIMYTILPYVEVSQIKDLSALVKDNANNKFTSEGKCHNHANYDFTDVGYVSQTLEGEEVCQPPPITGCTNADACNYDAAATQDDGSCNAKDCEGNCDGDNTGPAVEVCGGTCTGGGTGVTAESQQDDCGVCTNAGGDGSSCRLPAQADGSKDLYDIMSRAHIVGGGACLEADCQDIKTVYETVGAPNQCAVGTVIPDEAKRLYHQVCNCAC